VSTARPLPALTPAEVARFCSKLRLGGCGLTWAGETNNDGYGRFPVYRNGTRIRLLAHRVSCYLFTGEDPGPSVVRHQCDTRPCCTPDCFLLGTQADNVADAIARRRLNTTGLSAYRAIRIAEAAARTGARQKICVFCSHLKPMTDFAVVTSNPDGRAYWCRSCTDVHQALHCQTESIRFRATAGVPGRRALKRGAV
jgi:hypothetical protein